jgi:hypothetical protein
MERLAQDTFSAMRLEMVRTLGSMRGLLVLLLYISASGLTGAFYVFAVRALEEKAIELVAQNGGAGAAGRDAVDISKVPAYQSMIDSFAGDDKAKAELWKNTPPIVMVSFWLALAFLPFLVMVTAHDVLARDNELRTLRFVRPRTSMVAWVFGKFIAQTTLIFLVTVLSGLVIYAIGVIKLESFEAVAGGLAFANMWWRVLVFEVGFLGVMFVISAAVRSSFTALIVSAFSLFVLWILQFFSYWKEGEVLKPGGYIAYISPFFHKDGLWHPPDQALAISLGAYVAFAALGVALSIFWLQKREI